MSKDKYISLKNKEIRSYARERLLGNMLIPCLVTFFFFSTKNTSQLLISLGVFGKDMFSFFFYIALFLVINSLWGIIRYGITRFFITFVTTKKANPMSLLAGFRYSTNTIVGASFVIAFINILLELPYLIYTFFFAPDNIFGFGISLGLFIAASIFMFLIECYLFPVYFIICDYPDMNLATVIVMSMSLMSAKKFIKYIFLRISFIPLYLISLLSFGLGLLWVTPYAYTAYAYFYEDLCESYKADHNPENETEDEN